jgi:hypothetical protein
MEATTLIDKYFYSNNLMKGATVAGTYGYMAPEQFRWTGDTSQ